MQKILCLISDILARCPGRYARRASDALWLANVRAGGTF